MLFTCFIGGGVSCSNGKDKAKSIQDLSKANTQPEPLRLPNLSEDFYQRSMEVRFYRSAILKDIKCKGGGSAAPNEPESSCLVKALPNRLSAEKNFLTPIELAQFLQPYVVEQGRVVSLIYYDNGMDSHALGVSVDGLTYLMNAKGEIKKVELKTGKIQDSEYLGGSWLVRFSFSEGSDGAGPMQPASIQLTEDIYQIINHRDPYFFSGSSFMLIKNEDQLLGFVYLNFTASLINFYFH